MIPEFLNHALLDPELAIELFPRICVVLVNLEYKILRHLGIESFLDIYDILLDYLQLFSCVSHKIFGLGYCTVTHGCDFRNYLAVNRLFYVLFQVSFDLDTHCFYHILGHPYF